MNSCIITPETRGYKTLLLSLSTIVTDADEGSSETSKSVVLSKTLKVSLSSRTRSSMMEISDVHNSFTPGMNVNTIIVVKSSEAACIGCIGTIVTVCFFYPKFHGYALLNGNTAYIYLPCAVSSNASRETKMSLSVDPLN